MQFTSITLAVMALLTSVYAAPNDLAERSAANTLAKMEARANHYGASILTDTSSLTKRDCDCAAYASCRENCGVFNNAAGQAGGFCVLGCADSSGCGSNTLCCTDGTSCDGSGCCDA